MCLEFGQIVVVQCRESILFSYLVFEFIVNCFDSCMCIFGGGDIFQGDCMINFVGQYDFDVLYVLVDQVGIFQGLQVDDVVFDFGQFGGVYFSMIYGFQGNEVEFWQVMVQRLLIIFEVWSDFVIGVGGQIFVIMVISFVQIVIDVMVWMVFFVMGIWCGMQIVQLYGLIFYMQQVVGFVDYVVVFRSVLNFDGMIDVMQVEIFDVSFVVGQMVVQVFDQSDFDSCYGQRIFLMFLLCLVVIVFGVCMFFRFLKVV